MSLIQHFIKLFGEKKNVFILFSLKTIQLFLLTTLITSTVNTFIFNKSFGTKYWYLMPKINFF